MRTWSRRDMLKSGLLAAGAAMIPGAGQAFALGPAPTDGEAPAMAEPGPVGAALRIRERLLLDFGWRFHLGHADDPAQDFGFGTATTALRQDRRLLRAGTPRLRRPGVDARWTCRTTGRWTCPSSNDPAARLARLQAARPRLSRAPASAGTARRSTIPARGRRSPPVARVRRRLPRLHRHAQRRLPRHGAERLRPVPLRRHRLRQLRRRQRARGPRGRHRGRGVVLRGRGHLPARVAGEDRAGARAAVGHVRHRRRCSGDHRPRATAHDRGRTTARRTTVCRVRVAHRRPRRATQASAVRRRRTGRPRGRRTTVDQHDHGRRTPTLWSVETPHLYRLRHDDRSGRDAGGPTTRRRSASAPCRFDADRGFFLNGKRVELKGTCNHQDHAGVGSALPDRLQDYRIARLKEMGSQRLSHVAQPAHAGAARRLRPARHAGARRDPDDLVESRGAEPARAADPARPQPPQRLLLVDRQRGTGRRAPSAGARIAASDEAAGAAARPHAPDHRGDERLLGEGAVGGGRRAGLQLRRRQATSTPSTRQFPQQPTMGTETASTVSTRGIYANDKTRGYVSAYDVNFPPWAATAESWWTTYAARPWLAGGFVWTGFDYRGEPTPYGWPCINSHFGIMDTCGFPKDNFYYYQAWWGADAGAAPLPALELARAGGPGDRRLGAQQPRPGRAVPQRREPRAAGRARPTRTWRGTCRIARARSKRAATGAARSVADRHAGDHRSAGADRARPRPPDDRRRRRGRRRWSPFRSSTRRGASCRRRTTRSTFAVTGNGRLIGVGNGDPSSHDADKGTVRRAFNGLCRGHRAGVERGRRRATARHRRRPRASHRRHHVRARRAAALGLRTAARRRWRRATRSRSCPPRGRRCSGLRAR